MIEHIDLGDQDVVKRLADGSLQVITYGPEFAAQAARTILGLRKRLGETSRSLDKARMGEKILRERLEDTHRALNNITGFVYSNSGPKDYNVYHEAVTVLTRNRAKLDCDEVELPISGNLVSRVELLLQGATMGPPSTPEADNPYHAMRGIPKTRTNCSYHKGFKEVCGCP